MLVVNVGRVVDIDDRLKPVGPSKKKKHLAQPSTPSHVPSTAPDEQAQ